MTTEPSTTLRRCIGSAHFGIEAHEAPASEFPAQPSGKDGLGRMCRPHWRHCTNALRKASLERKAAEVAAVVEAPPEPAPEAPAKASARRRTDEATPTPEER